MQKGLFGKRGFLKAAGALAAGGAAAQASAQKSRIFGLDVPDEVMDLLPDKPLQFARLAETVLELEKEADFKRLPDTVLSRSTGQPFNPLEDTVYQVVLPRLVALIDRSETIDMGFADKAGSLLAQLHQTQHELPEALRLGDIKLGEAAPLHSRRALFHSASFNGQPLPVDIPPVISAPVIQPLPAPEAEPAPVPPEPALNQPLSRAKSFAALQGEYRWLWDGLAVRPERQETLDWHVTMIRKSRERYEQAGERTRVPWFFIAVTHALEASFNFRAHLHNGDFPLSARTRQVPAGRPKVWLPPSDWVSSATDAVTLLGFANQTDWSLERTLYRLEAYNGFGYRSLGVPTPYLWSFCQHYDRGKFVADGKFSRTARSQQCGAAVMLKSLVAAGEINWAREA